MVSFLSCSKKNEKETYWHQIDICQELGFKKEDINSTPSLYESYYKKFEINFCSAELNLYNDHSYEFESGCEARSNRSLGHWSIQKDTLILERKPLKELNLLYKYNVVGDTSSFFVIRVLNRFNQPIRNVTFITFSKNRMGRTGPFPTDNEGIIKLEKNQYDSISIVAFENITEKKITIKNINFPDSLTMNIFTDAKDYYGEPHYRYSDKQIKYKILNNKIIGEDNYVLMKRIK